MQWLVLGLLTAFRVGNNHDAALVIVVEHSAEAASTSDRSAASGEIGIRENEQIADALMVALTAIMRDEFFHRCPQASSPNRIIPSRQDSLIVRTNRSA